MQIPVNAPQGETTSIYMDDGSSLAGAGIRTESLPESDQYALQGEAQLCRESAWMFCGYMEVLEQ